MVEVAENGTGDNDHLKDIGEGVAADGGAENPPQKVLRFSQHNELEHGSEEVNPEQNIQCGQPIGNFFTVKKENTAKEKDEVAQLAVCFYLLIQIIQDTVMHLQMGTLLKKQLKRRLFQITL